MNTQLATFIKIRTSLCDINCYLFSIKKGKKEDIVKTLTSTIRETLR